jgi:hypothetical protein
MTVPTQLVQDSKMAKLMYGLLAIFKNQTKTDERRNSLSKRDLGQRLAGHALWQVAMLSRLLRGDSARSAAGWHVLLRVPCFRGSRAETGHDGCHRESMRSAKDPNPSTLLLAIDRLSSALMATSHRN